MDARKERLGPADALRLARAAKRIIVAKGKSILTIDMTRPPPRDELLAALLGPTGNLRAPAIVSGDTLIVGFNEDAAKAAGLG